MKVDIQLFTKILLSLNLHKINFEGLTDEEITDLFEALKQYFLQIPR